MTESKSSDRQTRLKRVCHLTSVHIPFDTRIFHKECRSLVEAGYDVHLIAPHLSCDIVNGIHIHPVPQRTRKLARMLLTPFDVFSMARKLKADLYHFHDPELIFVGLLLKLSGNIVIEDVHEDYPDYIRYKEWIPKWLRIPLAKLASFTERFSARFFDAVVTVVPVIYERFASFHPHTVYVRNFPRLEELSPRTAISSQPNDPDTIPAVVYIGSLSRDRGVVEMVQAVERVNEKCPLRLILGGSFVSSAFEKEVQHLSGYQYVDFRGFLNREGVAQALDESTAGLVVLHPLSNYRESYSIKLFEYMSAGLPVVASDFPRWRPMIGDIGSGLMIDSTSPEAIAEAITTILDNPERSAHMGEQGRKAVSVHYNWETEESSLLSLYDKLLNK